MDDTVGHVVYGPPAGTLVARPAHTADGPPPYGSETAREIESAVRRLTQEALGRALAILAANRAPLDGGAHRLLDKETLTRDARPTLATGGAPPAEPAEAP